MGEMDPDDAGAVGGDGLTVLLVEDNPGDARYIREMLRGAEELSERATTRGGTLAARTVGGAHSEPTLVHETRLEDGLERLTDGQVEDAVDAVLLDLNLPDSEGLATLETLRERAEAVPVVVLTGLRDRELGMEALRRGADEYLVKDEINAELLVRSVYHAVERKAHERELEQYRSVIEAVSDGVYAVDDESRFVLVNDAMVAMTGHSREELLGSPSSRIVSREAIAAAEERTRAIVAGDEKRGMLETELQTADARSVPVETNFSPFPVGEDRYGRAGVIRDITERKARERQLARQRNQLATLNSLNELVHEISRLAIESSTREEIERLVCEHLADSEPYLFAWVGEVDRDHETVTTRTEAGVEGYLESFTIKVDEREEGMGPTGRAVHTGEVQVARVDDADGEPVAWREHAGEYGFRSSAAIPIGHEGTLYGVLNVYSERPDAFEDDERSVVGRLGAVIGHAINSIERKRGLMSEDVVEIRFRVADVLDAFGVDAGAEGTISFDRAIPLSDEEFLEYGTVTPDAVETLRALVDRLPHFQSVTIEEEGRGPLRFELRMTEPPAMSTIASHGGRVESAVIDDGDYRMVVHVPPSADVSRVVEAVKEDYPEASVVAQRHTTRADTSVARLQSELMAELTDRQRAALESAYFSGYFEWPRASSGEDIAASMGVSPPTFHEHVRVAERKLLDALFDPAGLEE